MEVVLDSITWLFMALAYPYQNPQFLEKVEACTVSFVVVTLQVPLIIAHFWFVSNLLVLAALQLSVQDSTNDQSNPTDMSKLLADQSFVSSILASVSLLYTKLCYFTRESMCFSLRIAVYIFCHFWLNFAFDWQLPGVDPNDPSVKDLLASMQGQSEVS